MKPKFKPKSPVDSIIIDMIIEHYNIQSLSGLEESLSGEEFEISVKRQKRFILEQY